jgi:hypothetical protein
MQAIAQVAQCCSRSCSRRCRRHPRHAAPPAAPRAAVGNYDQLLALAGESRISAHQLAPIGRCCSASSATRPGLFQAIEQLHEALLHSGDAGLLEKARAGAAKDPIRSSSCCTSTWPTSTAASGAC